VVPCALLMLCMMASYSPPLEAPAMQGSGLLISPH